MSATPPDPKDSLLSAQLCQCVLHRRGLHVRQLLAQGASADARWTGYPALHYAATAAPPAGAARQFADDPADLAALLLRAGADPDAGGPGGVTPLHVAAQQGRDRIAALLLAAGARPDPATPRGETPLHLAMGPPRERIVALLIEAGADPDAQDQEGRTPLHLLAQWARAQKDPERAVVRPATRRTLARLRSAGARLDRADHSGRSPEDILRSVLSAHAWLELIGASARSASRMKPPGRPSGP